MDLLNRKIVVIGGTSGIGWSAAKAFLKLQAQVVVVGLETHSEVHGENPSLIVHYADAREEATITKAILACEDTFGSFDGLYHVAGGSGRKWGDGPLHSLTLDAWNKTLKLNLESVMLSNRGAIAYWLEREMEGTILNLSSVLALHPAPHLFSTHAYATAKAAIIGLSKSLASYYAVHNIRVNVLAPALTDTPMAQRAASDEHITEYIKTKQPLADGRIGEVSDLDTAACYFLSTYSSYVTGQVLKVDGGWSVSEGQYVS